MSAKYGNYSAPADEAVAVVNDAVISPPSRGLYIGVGGDVTVNMALTGTAILFKSVPTGTVLPIAVVKVTAAGTGATNIIALY